MDLSDLVTIATQISMAGTQFESTAFVLQNSGELNKHCMDLVREKFVPQESPMMTVQFLAKSGIRNDKLRETTRASISAIGSAKSVPYTPFKKAIAPTEIAESVGTENVWMTAGLGNLENFVRSYHEEFLNDTLYERSRVSEYISLCECTKIITDECGQLSEASMSGHLFPAGKAMKPEVQSVVRFYYDIVSRVKPPQSSNASITSTNNVVDLLQCIPSEMPSTHPNAKSASILWKTLKAVLPPPSSSTPPPSSSSSSSSFTPEGSTVRSNNDGNRTKWNLASFANKGMVFLQGKFADIIRNTVDSNLSRARVSSTAGFDAKVEGFLKIIGRGFNTWGKMYYLILSGEHKLALSLITNKEGVIERAISEFCSNKPISEGSYDKLLRMRNNPRNDKYLNIILSVLLRDINGIPQLGSVDELLWVTLAIARGSENGECDGISYDAISRVYKQLEKSRKSFSGSPYVYVSALVLLGKFKEAAEYLWDSRDECAQIDAAHLALAIALRVSSKTTVDDENNEYDPTLSITNNGSDNSNEEDKYYIYSDKCSGRSLAAVLTRIVEEYPTRVGLTNKGASPYLGLVVTLPGGTILVRRFLNESSLAPTSSSSSASSNSPANNLSRMLKDAGKDTERFCAVAEALGVEGSIKKAMYLFNSIGEYGRAAHLLYTLLSAVVQLPANDPERRELMKFAAALRKHREMDITLRRLCAMAEFFDYYNSGKWVDAVTQPDFSGLIPGVDSSMEAVEKCAQLFTNPYKTPKEVSQNVPGILVATMECIYHCCVLETDKHLISQLRERVKGIVIFAALVADRLPPETSATILRIREQIERN